MQISDKQWLNMVQSFDIGPSKKYNGNGPGAEVKLDKMKQMDGSIKWTVRLSNYCLGKDGNYYHEPIPSERSDEFLKMCRFDSKEEAYQTWLINEKAPKKNNQWIEVKEI